MGQLEGEHFGSNPTNGVSTRMGLGYFKLQREAQYCDPCMGTFRLMDSRCDFRMMSWMGSFRRSHIPPLNLKLAIWVNGLGHNGPNLNQVASGRA